MIFLFFLKLLIEKKNKIIDDRFSCTRIRTLCVYWIVWVPRNSDIFKTLFPRFAHFIFVNMFDTERSCEFLLTGWLDNKKYTTHTIRDKFSSWSGNAAPSKKKKNFNGGAGLGHFPNLKDTHTHRHNPLSRNISHCKHVSVGSSFFH